MVFGALSSQDACRVAAAAVNHEWTASVYAVHRYAIAGGVDRPAGHGQ